MHWNHRVVKYTTQYTHEEEQIVEEVYQVCEVFYNSKDEPTGHCEATLSSETIEGLQIEVERFAKALTQPVLDADTDFKGNYFDDDEDDEDDEEYINNIRRMYETTK
jgi:hypothetical protein